MDDFKDTKNCAENNGRVQTVEFSSIKLTNLIKTTKLHHLRNEWKGSKKKSPDRLITVSRWGFRNIIWFNSMIREWDRSKMPSNQLLSPYKRRLSSRKPANLFALGEMIIIQCCFQILQLSYKMSGTNISSIIMCNNLVFSLPEVKEVAAA